MKKGYKIIQLNGTVGLILILLAILVAIGCVAVLPIYGVKFLWNSFISENFEIQTIRLSQASLLWFAILAVIYGHIRSKVSFRFVSSADIANNMLSKEDYEKFLEHIKKEQENDEKINH